MNIIEMIKNTLSSGAVGQLGSLIGASPEQTRAAAGAAVPSILAGLSKTASTREGADRLSELLNNLDPNLINNPGAAFSGGDPNQLANKGTSILNEVLGGGMLGNLGGLLSKFSGLGGGMITKLLGMLAPFIMGIIAKQFGGKASPQGLTQFFNEQKGNIANAMPAGFSLGNIPGFGDVGAKVQQAANTVKKEASPLMWVVAVLLIALGVALWYYLKPDEPVRMPANTDLAKNIAKTAEAGMTDSINSYFTTATETFTNIKDAASADAALPKLKALSDQADVMKKGFTLLPEAGKSTIKTLLGSQMDKLKAIVDKLLAMPVVGEKLKPVVEPLMAKLTGIAG